MLNQSLIRSNPRAFRSLSLLTLSQGFFITTNVCFIAINGLVGLRLAPQAWMATFAVMTFVLGGALTAPLVGWAQTHFGRKRAFQLGLAVAAIALLVCAWAVWIGSFWLLCFATLVAGYYNANAQLYRFAAAELSPPEIRSKAVSWVLAGGLIGAILGPNLARWTEHSFEVPFVGAYLALFVLLLIGIPCIQAIAFPATSTPSKQAHTPDQAQGRSSWEIVRQPIFLVATACSAFGYGIMGLLMTATPVAMDIEGFTFSDAASVIQWHVLGMFIPGFFTGALIQRYGSTTILWAGLFLNLLCVLLAFSGTDLHHFTFALILLGVGWNFLFTASTTLLLQAYRPEERDRAQSINNTAVLTAQVFTALLAGTVVQTDGWSRLNLGSLAAIVLMALSLLYYLWYTRKASATS